MNAARVAFVEHFCNFSKIINAQAVVLMKFSLILDGCLCTKYGVVLNADFSR